MTKLEFISALSEKLKGLPQDDISERLNFYAEMIEDRMEEGISEQEAVAAVGDIDEIVAQIVTDIPLTKIAKEKIKSKRRLKVWEIVLLVLGSPIWLALGIAAVAVIFAVYISFWAVIISLWAVFVSIIGCSLSGVAAGIIFACTGNALAGIAMVGAGIVCAGLSIYMFYACKGVTKAILTLTKKFAVWTKNCIIGKEVA